MASRKVCRKLVMQKSFDRRAESEAGETAVNKCSAGGVRREKLEGSENFVEVLWTAWVNQPLPYLRTAGT